MALAVWLVSLILRRPLSMDEPDSLQSLCQLARRGARLRYLFFWGHTSTSSETIGKECLSQWYPAPFVVDGHRFPTAEHFMMYRKALLFRDEAVAEQILLAPNPGAVKSLGRSVRRFEQGVWDERRFSIVTEGNRAKFGSDPALAQFLLDTKKRVLVEASPVDRIWGIGLAADDKHAENPLKWRGLNLLGFALMVVRHELQRQRAQV